MVYFNLVYRLNIFFSNLTKLILAQVNNETNKTTSTSSMSSLSQETTSKIRKKNFVFLFKSS